jgi:hypothetical protein
MFFDSALPDLSNIESCNFVHKDYLLSYFFLFCFLVGVGRHACMNSYRLALVVIDLFTVVER